MPTATKSPAKKSPSKKSETAQKSPPKKAASKDATALLKADHKLVAGLFNEFEKAPSDARKTAIVAQICKFSLSFH